MFKKKALSHIVSAKAFTLIELLVVVAIIGLLASVIIAALSVARTKANNAAHQQLDANYYHNLGDSLISQYLFDDGTANDSSGYGRNGTLSFGATVSSDTPFGVGQSLYLPVDGVNGMNKMTVSGPPNVTGNVTFAFWTRFNNTDTSVAQYVFDYPLSYDCSSRTCRFLCYLVSSYLYCGDGLTSASVNFTKAPLSQSQMTQWHFWVVSKTAGASAPSVYRDGSNVSINYWGGGGSYETDPRGFIGIESGFYGSYPMGGSIDSFRIYDRTLDAMEVEKLYAIDAPKHGLAFVGAYWPLGN